MPRYRIVITSKDREAMLDLVRKYHLDVSDHGSRYSESTGYTIDAAADATNIAKLKQAGYNVQKHEDIDKLGRERQCASAGISQLPYSHRRIGRGRREQLMLAQGGKE
jgi:hypothetical protein